MEVGPEEQPGAGPAQQERPREPSRRWKVAGAVAGVAGLIVASLFVGGAVFASSGSAPATATSTSSNQGAGQAREGVRPFGGVVHGDLQLRRADGTTESVTFDRGTIDSIGGGSVALTRRDGSKLTLRYDGSTVVREQGKPSSIDDLKAGERAMFFSQDGLVRFVRCVREADSSST